MTILEDLQQLVETESPSDDAEAVTRAARFVATTLSTRGVSARLVSCRGRGDAALATLGEGNGGTLLLGHLDTVWPVGTLREIPFSFDEATGIARGPGIFDMKAGCVAAMHALGALAQDATFLRRSRVSMLLVPDEEIGSDASRSLLIETARSHDRVFVLEPSAPGGAAKVARKGTGNFRVRFRGIPSHAGLEPEKGASALAEMARFVLECASYQSGELGTTVTPTLARAGSKANVVPETAEVTLDCRVWSQAEAARVEERIRTRACDDARTSVEVDGGFDRPPLEETDASRALFACAKGIALDLGFELGAARVGGASDGNLTGAAGVPTLDGLGPIGDGAHARHEHVVVSDISRRIELIRRLILSF